MSREGRRIAAARIHREQAIVLRTSGRPAEAGEHFRQALEALEGLASPQAVDLRIDVLQSYSIALDELGDHQRSLAMVELSVPELKRLAESGHADTDRGADTFQRCANQLLKYGYFDAARDAGAEALRMYDRLIERGRADLVLEAARLRAAHATCLQRLGDHDAATAEFSTALEGFRSRTNADPLLEATVIPIITVQVDELLEVCAIDAADVPSRLGAAQAEIQRAAGALKGADARIATMMLEQTVGELLWLNRRHPSGDGLILAGAAGALMGDAAADSKRFGAMRHGYGVAAAAYKALVLNGRKEFLDGWGGCCVGLVNVASVRGEDAEADAILRDLERDLRRIDPAAAVKWKAIGVRVLNEVRGSG